MVRDPGPEAQGMLQFHRLGLVRALADRYLEQDPEPDPAAA